MRQLVRSLHQIEITSRCNLACKYCVHPHMKRPKEDMDRDTFIKCLQVANHFVRAGTQQELNLAGIGESTMHTNFVEFVHLAREAVGWNCHLVLSTNGVAMTDDMIEGIKSSGISIYVSPHRPEKAAKPIKKLREVGLLKGLSEGAWTASVDWAGQLDWPVTAPTKDMPCPWIPNGRVTAFSDGRLSTCCFDSDRGGVVGHIDDLVNGKELFVEPYKLCGPCHHVVSEEVLLNRTA